MLRYYIDSFGCAKNQVDSETICAVLNQAYSRAENAEDADIIIVNSCGFIESAKKESIDAVLGWRKFCPEKKIILAGCLAERYKKELSESLPEADALFGIADINRIVSAVDKLTGADNAARRLKAPAPGSRPLLSLPGSAYVKISEGCDNRCSFCAIPLIRGNVRSRSIEDITGECEILLERGIKELCIVAQDSASYGKDLGMPAHPGLAGLMENIAKLNGEFWVRLLYIHPDHFPLPVLDIMKSDKRFLPYFDLPFQHASEKILRLMNRRGSAETYLGLIETIRSNLPDAVIRTTFMTGFPGESEEDFNELLDFQKEARLDWMGCFAYSREEETPAYSMKNRVSKKTAAERKQTLEERQIPITGKQMDRFLKRGFDVLIEEKIEDNDEGSIWLGRLPFQAPEIDGSAVISGDPEPKVREPVPGTLVKGRVFARIGVDLEVSLKGR